MNDHSHSLLPTPEHHTCNTGEDGIFIVDIVNMNMYIVETATLDAHLNG